MAITKYKIKKIKKIKRIGNKNACWLIDEKKCPICGSGLLTDNYLIWCIYKRCNYSRIKSNDNK